MSQESQFIPHGAPEFQDTPTDVAAVSLLLRAADHPAAISKVAATLNAGWDDLAPRLAGTDEAAFQKWVDTVEAFGAEERPEVFDRARDLTSHLIGWRLGDV